VEPGHGHAAQPAFGWGWIGLVLICSFVGGLAIQSLLSKTLSADEGIRLLTLRELLEDARPAGTLADMQGRWIAWTWPNEHFAHEPEQFYEIVAPVTLLATGTWLAGIGLATIMYCLGYLNAEDVRRQFSPIYRFLVNKWWFDELYNAIWVQPTHVLSRFVAGIDRRWIDALIDGAGRCTVWIARRWEFIADRVIVDGFVNVFAGWTYSAGVSLRNVQTGRLRQYVLFIVVGAVALFILVSFFWTPTLAR
jgi:NADH-quinone oxidoreductase subunit L